MTRIDTKTEPATGMVTRRNFLRLVGLAAVATACGEAVGASDGDSVAASTTSAAGGQAQAAPPASTASPRQTIVSTTSSTTAPTTSATPTTTMGPITTTMPPGIDAAAMLSVEPRTAWGAAEPIESRLLAHSGSLQFATVHHAGDRTSATGPPRYQSWQRFHMEDRGWGDLAYHFVIGVDGTVYEGRAVALRGDTATEYDPDRHFLVVVEGNFDAQSPTTEQLDVLPVVVAWAVEAHGIPPAGIAGHRDYANTSCPGSGLYPYVAGDLQREVEALIAAGGISLD